MKWSRVSSYPSSTTSIGSHRISNYYFQLLRQTISSLFLDMCNFLPIIHTPPRSPSLHTSFCEHAIQKIFAIPSFVYISHKNSVSGYLNSWLGIISFVPIVFVRGCVWVDVCLICDISLIRSNKKGYGYVGMHTFTLRSSSRLVAFQWKEGWEMIAVSCMYSAWY